ncbi:L,D-transpeptidase [Streptomyces sp. NPDC052040]|uniref:L,D-transpeptidase n=1 Tax=unclassified Streptomyces TaxID=2593676 RepID=UPI0037D83E23
MSDQQSPHPLTERELSARLHGLAEDGAAPAPATGAQVRSRAVRRRRGRRAALSAAVLAVAAVTAVTVGGHDSPTGRAVPPAAPPPRPSPSPVQRVTVDLDAHTLTIEGRTFRISGLQDNCPIGETVVTVTGKHPLLTTPPDRLTKYRDDERWAVTFTDRSHHQRLLLWALDPSAGLNAIGEDAGTGAIALSPEDGKRVYDTIRLGAQVEIRGRQGASADPVSVCNDRRPITTR